jgi:hypothetical protein
VWYLIQPTLPPPMQWRDVGGLLQPPPAHRPDLLLLLFCLFSALYTEKDLDESEIIVRLCLRRELLRA